MIRPQIDISHLSGNSFESRHYNTSLNYPKWKLVECCRDLLNIHEGCLKTSLNYKWSLNLCAPNKIAEFGDTYFKILDTHD